MLTGEELGDAIRRAIEIKNVKKVAVAAYFGVKPPSVQDWIKRGTIGKEKLPLLWAYFADAVPAQHWGLDSYPKLFAGAETSAAIPGELIMREVPVVGTAQLGDSGHFCPLEYPVGEGDGKISWPTKDPGAYALRCRGESMRPRIQNGEFVVIEPMHSLSPGDEVAVRANDERVMVKQWAFTRDGTVYLDSINESHPRVAILEAEIFSMHYVAGIAKRPLWKD